MKEEFAERVNRKCDIRKNIFACLFSIHKTINLSRHEQVCLSGYVSRDTSPIAHLNILVHDVINLLYYNKCDGNKDLRGLKRKLLDVVSEVWVILKTNPGILKGGDGIKMWM